MTFPRLALSVRQPWAWAILHAGKDFENRDWKPSNPGLRFTGRCALHAAVGMTQAEYRDAADFMASIGVIVPPPAELPRGGIVGAVTVVRAVALSSSDWFFGPVGLKLANPRPCEFIPSVGKLGFFAWEPSGAKTGAAPARWMLREVRR